MKILEFYYFGARIEYLPAEELVIYDAQYWDVQHLRPVLQNEILYRMQEHVKVEHHSQRTLRAEIHSQTGKPLQVVVPMLVNMQGEASKVVNDLLHGLVGEDVPY